MKSQSPNAPRAHLAGTSLEHEIMARSTEDDTVAVFHSERMSFVTWSFHAPYESHLEQYASRTTAIEAFDTTVTHWESLGILDTQTAPGEARR